MKDKGEEAGAGREPSDHDAAPTPVKEEGEQRRWVERISDWRAVSRKVWPG